MEMTRDSIISEKCRLMRGGQKEQQACLSILNSLKSINSALWDKVNERTEKTTFTTRHYGGGQFYTWVNHADLGTLDPWPASRFPKTVLATEHLLALVK